MSKLITTTCPNCNASVDLDPEHLISFCGFCGSKLMIDVETIQSILIEREKTKQKEVEFQTSTKLAEINAKKELELSKTDKKYDNTSTILLILLLFLIFLGIFTMIIMLIVKSDNSEKRHANTISQLSSYDSEIEDLIRKKDFEEASRINKKIKQLIDDSFSYDERAAWIREYYDNRSIIESNKREDSGIAPQRIRMSQSSNEIKEMKYSDAIDYLYDIGFYNIKVNRIKEDSYSKRGMVKNISIDGNTNFKEGSRYEDDAEIIVSYYDR